MCVRVRMRGLGRGFGRKGEGDEVRPACYVWAYVWACIYMYVRMYVGTSRKTRGRGDEGARVF